MFLALPLIAAISMSTSGRDRYVDQRGRDGPGTRLLIDEYPPLSFAAAGQAPHGRADTM